MTSPATDPRAARSREAILAAAFDLLAREGPGAITHQRLAAAFALAVDAGELDKAPDADLAAAHLIGPLVYRTTLQAAPVPDRLLTAVIDAVAPGGNPAWRHRSGPQRKQNK